jgi:hypothetical protein
VVEVLQSRRQWMQSVFGSCAALLAAGCDPYNTREHERERERKREEIWKAMTPQEQALAKRFSVLGGGGELFVDAFGEKFGINILDERGHRFYGSAGLRSPGNSKHAYLSGFGVPQTLRVEWRDREEGIVITDVIYEQGNVVGNYTVPVASRIPDALLEDMRKNGGTFRLKIRIHDDGPLIGWDIQRGSDYFMTGGDFKERRVIYVPEGKGKRKVWEKGWYIHPKTKERIETDF